MGEGSSTLEILDFGPAPSDFRAELVDGLGRDPKSIPSKYFYDEQGSALFDRICQLEEYYPTRTELAILREHAGAMAARLGPECLLVEYGSGSSIKTRLLLEALEEPAGYVPVDISREHLARSAGVLDARHPGLEVLPVCADYTGDYSLPQPSGAVRRVGIYFPGSTIGNFTPPQAREFLAHTAEVSGESGGLLIGVDLKKDRELLERAYDDAEGVTAAFNKNVLTRANREVGSDFDLDAFRHVALYDEKEGRIEMHLESTRPQVVRVGSERFDLHAGERIHTENSYKYEVQEFGALASSAGYRPDAVWTDPDSLFSVHYLSVR